MRWMLSILTFTRGENKELKVKAGKKIIPADFCFFFMQKQKDFGESDRFRSCRTGQIA